MKPPSPEAEQEEAEDEQDGAERTEDTDTSYEDVLPSTSRGSPGGRSSIQSNKVDSSGLNATPPHQRDAEFEQLRGGGAPGDGALDLDSSLDRSRTERGGSDDEDESEHSLCHR